MANTFNLIASSTATGLVANFDFTSIPATFTDLCLKISARTDNSDGAAIVWFNNDTNAANYSKIRLIGEGTSGVSGSGSNDSKVLFVDDSSKTGSIFGNTEIYIPNYLSGNQKSMSVDSVVEDNANYAIDGLFGGKWITTSAINRITIAPQTGNFVQYSTAYLYGIKNS